MSEHVAQAGLAALRDVDFDWTSPLQGIWHDPPYHVEDLHHDVVDDLIDYFARHSGGPHSPLGRVIVGPAGAGKTHLIGQLRRRAWEAKGWFVLLDIVGIKDFWSTAALCFVTSLLQPMPNGQPQYEAALSAILRRFANDPNAREAVGDWQQAGAGELIVALLRRIDVGKGLKCAEIVKALLLLSSDDLDRASLAYAWLQGFEVDPDRRAALGLVNAQPLPAEIVRGLSWILSIAGPTVIAVDQIDAIVAASNLRAGSEEGDNDDAARMAQSIIELLAGGLMDLKDVTARSLTVVACLEATWQVLRDRALKPALDRFQAATALGPIGSHTHVERLIAARLGRAYANHQLAPPYPAWPYTASAIDSATGLLPRQILMKCDEHRKACIAEKKCFECASLGEGKPSTAPPAPPSGLDAEFARQLSEAEIDGRLLAKDDDTALSALVLDVLTLFAKEIETPADIDISVQGDPDQRRPSLHGRLTFTFRSEGDREQHYCFRALGHGNAIAFQARLKAAMTASGIDRALKFRHLCILRRDAPPGGPKTAQLVEQFKQAEGRFIAPGDEDLRTFVALRALHRSHPVGFEDWLRARKPLGGTAFFREAGLCPPPFLPAQPPDPRGEAPSPAPIVPQPATGSGKTGAATVAPDAPPRAVPVGRRHEHGIEGEPLHLPADLLPRHVAILAGSGSGKTVLLRRIVEEAALLDIPAIVLDTNNDLARLGDVWPARPSQWTQADAASAAAYQDRVEVILWTPGIAGGNPLSLSLLPDFSALDDEDERSQAIDLTHATLVPYIGAGGAGGKLRSGVLADALRRFARNGAGGLQDLARLLSDLPDDVSQIGNAPRLAGAIADQLRAEIAVNPLLQAHGQPLDPGILFQGAARRTRISVINFAGLVSDEARQAFVNQLQMALFSWVRNHPSPRGRLYVLDEAQNFAPSQAMTPCKASTIALAAQARKYGLGMIFATQAPKGIDNKIISNCTTQFYGRMSAPSTIQAVRELMAAKGGAADDIGKLRAGEFYYSTEGLARPIKLRVPFCLSHHPQNPLSADEVAAKAHRHSLSSGSSRV